MGQLLAILGGLALAVSHVLILFYAPLAADMGLTQKIFYLHLSLAWWGLTSFFTVFVASLLYLVRRWPLCDYIARGAMELGLLMATLALFSGMVWGRTAWGVWWTWDPRLTTTLVMCFLYASCILARSLGAAPMTCAALGVMAFLDVPLVFFSARIWRSIHPAIFVAGSSGLFSALEWRMAAVTLWSVLALGILWTALLYLRLGQMKLQARLDRLIADRSEQAQGEDAWMP